MTNKKLLTSSALTLSFIKYQSLGNDFILFDWIHSECPPSVDPLGQSAAWKKMVRSWCNRQMGIGADGILILSKDKVTNNIHATIFNQDGSDGDLCLNGARCIAHYLAVTEKGTNPGVIIMGKTRIEYVVSADGTLVEITIPATAFQGPTPYTVEGTQLAYTVDIGNPHLIIFDQTTVPQLITTATQLSEQKRFSNGINIEFVWQSPATTTDYQMLIYERGVGITQACSSGACAVLYTLFTLQKIAAGHIITLHMPGGALQGAMNTDCMSVMLRATASPLFEGAIPAIFDATT